MGNLLDIKNLMQKHDFYYEYAEGQNEWRKGQAEKDEILRRMRDLSNEEIKELFYLIPEKLQPDWFFAIQKFDKPNS